MRTVLLLLVLVGLLAGSLQAVAHVDQPAPTSSHGIPYAGGGDAPGGDERSGAQNHCDLCAHGFGHFALAVPTGAMHAFRDISHTDTPALSPPAGRPDRQDRPPK